MEYRIYVLGKDNHFVGVHHVECGDDDQALAVATQLLDGADLEIWQGDRRVGQLKGSGEAPSS
jgi:hypothetical protein